MKPSPSMGKENVAPAQAACSACEPTNPRISYVYSKTLIDACDSHPVHKRSADGKGRNRNRMAHSLIRSLGLLKLHNVSVVEDEPARIRQAAMYHEKYEY